MTAVPLKCQVQVLLLGLHGKEAFLLVLQQRRHHLVSQVLHRCLSVHQVLLDQYLPFQHVHNISSCPRQVSPQQEADISSVGTDQATPQRQGSSGQIDEPVAQSTSDEQSLQQAFSGVQESCKEAAGSSQSF